MEGEAGEEQQEDPDGGRYFVDSGDVEHEKEQAALAAALQENPAAVEVSLRLVASYMQSAGKAAGGEGKQKRDDALSVLARALEAGAAIEATVPAVVGTVREATTTDGQRVHEIFPDALHASAEDEGAGSEDGWEVISPGQR